MDVSIAAEPTTVADSNLIDQAINEVIHEVAEELTAQTEGSAASIEQLLVEGERSVSESDSDPESDSDASDQYTSDEDAVVDHVTTTDHVVDSTHNEAATTQTSEYFNSLVVYVNRYLDAVKFVVVQYFQD